jgi:NF-kappa-B inhibitor-like protein 1
LCLLLRLGADPAHQDRHGDTALHAAARQGPDGELPVGNKVMNS